MRAALLVHVYDWFLKILKPFCLYWMFVFLQACGGGNSTSTATDTDNDTTAGSSADTITVSGSVLASSSDVMAVASYYEKFKHYLASFNPSVVAQAAQATGAASNTALNNAAVTLWKVFGGDTAASQVDIGTVTTDTSGAFQISNLEAAPAGSGANTDFYYEVRVAKGELTLRSPAAPRSDGTVNVSPETDLAAKILSDVVEVPSDQSPPIPGSTVIESAREMVVQDVADLIDADSVTIPTVVGTAGQDEVLATANGVAAAGGNAEKIFKAAAFESEYLSLSEEGANANTTDVSGYLSRVVRESCNQSTGDYFPQPIAEALANFFVSSDNTVTIAEIISAYNNHYAGTALVSENVLSEFTALLQNVESNQGVAANNISALTAEDQVALYIKRSLSANAITVNTELSIDQAAAFVQLMGSDSLGPCELDSQLDLYAFWGELIGDTALATPRVGGFQIYHNSGFGCNEGSGEGHFYAEVTAYRGAKNITSVVITSSDSSALGGDGTETLTLEGNRYISNTNGVCVTLGSQVTYTITINFNDGNTAVRMVQRNHPRIPEASSEVLVSGSFVTGSGDSSSPTVVTTARPLYRWTSPSDMLTSIINDSANTAVSSDLAVSSAVVKYTYEFSHVDTTATNVSPASVCGSVSSGRLYAVSSFMPTIDCDIQSCATALGIDASDVACRINIQSYYVNRLDKILGQAAGHFRFFCVDTDTDGSCG